jgi:hypothetical protein
MTDGRRRIIAFIAAKLVSDKSSTSIYDYQDSKYTSVSGSVNAERVNVYDYERRCYISGNFSGTKFSLYDYGDSSYVDLKQHQKINLKDMIMEQALILSVQLIIGM